MKVVRFVVGLLALALVSLVWGARGALAQDAQCGPVAVGEGTGVYFLALGENCSADQADGYAVIAHLVRDDESSEVLVLVDGDHDDEVTQAVAHILAERVKDGTIDGGTWHDQPDG